MSRYLKHFTAVGDDNHSFNKQHEEEFHRDGEEPSLHSVEHSLTFRESLKKLFGSHKFQVSVVCLVILDAVFVLCELLLDLAIIKQDEHKISSQVFHYLSLALLTFFMMELFGKLFAYRLEFFHHKFEVFDGIVVIVSFVLDIVYVSHEDAFDGVGLLILLRLWRVARIVNGNAAPLEHWSPAVLHTGIHAVAVPGDKVLEHWSPLLETRDHAAEVPKVMRAREAFRYFLYFS
ncbi:HVCN1 protein, partial [Polyodon spathula]|nr:HVCN1 protein [Polyodon spathula]